jgi:LacI family transcriptional regulator
MPNQRDIAKALGVSQVAVSLALRGDTTISPELRKKTLLMAQQLGYRPNPYVSTLMTHIRTGRKPSKKGIVAMIADGFLREDWHGHESYRVYYEGAKRRSAELGFALECFFLKEPGVSAASIDRILYARGIRGVILAPPYLGNRQFSMKWSRYACVGTGYGWGQQQFDRVAHDHDQNVVLACERLRELGYERIGISLPTFYYQGRGTRWIDGFLTCQHRLPEGQRVPAFIGSVPEKSLVAFRKWHALWKPDVVLTLYGHEREWLEAMGLNVPRDIGLACLIRPPSSSLAGLNDRYDHIGAATVELVASKIALNQYGIPAYSKIILIEGQWVDGQSLRQKGPQLSLGF